MKHIAAYALIVLSGKDKVAASDVEKVLKDAGVKAESDKVEALVKALEGKAFHEIVSEGLSAMSSMGSAAPAAATTSGTQEAAKEEEKQESEEEEADLDMDDLFG